MPVQSATGTYIGDGAPRTILVGWQPDIAFVKGDLTEPSVFCISSMPAGKSRRADNVFGLVDDLITGFVADGFTVGTLDPVNKVGITYHWFAIQADGVSVKVGSYAGNHVNNRAIPVNFAGGGVPIYVVVANDYIGGLGGSRDVPHRLADDPYTDCGLLANEYSLLQMITSLYDSGFVVSNQLIVNATGYNYYWLAIKGAAGFSTHGTYVGNGADNRDIAVGGGVTPGLVIVSGLHFPWQLGTWWWYPPMFRTTAHTSEKCSQFNTEVDSLDKIQALAAASFQVGAHVNVNQYGAKYYWVALDIEFVGSSVSDVGVGVDFLTVWESVRGCSKCAVDVSASAKPTAHPWSHAVVALPNALMLIYQEGTAGLMYVFTPDEGFTWSSPVLITPKTNVYPSAVADIHTGDVHLIYSEAGDPVLGAGHSVYYRSLIYLGTTFPAWNLGAEVEVAYGSSGAGYANAVLSVEEGSYDPLVVGGYDGKLMGLAQRKTDTDRSWSVLVATAPWTLQGAVETPVAIPASSSGERAAAAQASGKLYVVTNTGGRYALYRSGVVDWGTASVEFVAWDGWGADDNEGFGLAVDFWGCQNQQYEYLALYGGGYLYGDGLLYGSSGMGVVLLVDREAAVAYIKDGQIHYREWSLPLTDNESWRIMYDWIIWSPKNAYRATISRVGQTYRVSAVVGMPSAVKRSVVYADGPDHSAWFTVSEDAAEENWDWIGAPQYATSGFNWIAAWGATAGPPNNVYMGRCPLTISFLLYETALGADWDSLLIPVAEGGSGAETLTLVVRVIDAGTGATVATILHSLEDIGIGSEITGSARVMFDVGGSLEALALAIALADAGAGADVPVINLSLLDAGASIETLVRQIMTRVYDVGVGLDTQGLSVSVVDTGSGSEIPLITIAMVDSGTGAEEPVIILSVADSGTALEIANMLFYMLETGAGGEALGLGVPVVDAAIAADSVRILLNIVEGGIGSDQVSATIYVTLALLRLLVARGTLRLDIAGPGL